MRLANKFTLALVAGTTLVLAANTWVHILRQTQQFESDMRHDHLLLGRAVEAALMQNFRTGGGDKGAENLVQAVSAKESAVAVTWLPQAEAADVGLSEQERLAIDAIGSVVQRRKAGDFLTYSGITVDGNRHGVLILSEAIEREERSFARVALVQALVELAATALVCAVVALLLGVAFVGRPMHQLVAFARQVGGGDFSPRLHLAQRDEIGQLSREMNAMAEHLQELTSRAAREQAARLAALEQLRHAERLATVGKLAAGIAHELGTPLATVAGRARLILDAPEREPATHARLIIEQTSAIVKIVRQLMDFARRRPPRKVAEELRRLCTGTLELLRPMAEKTGVELVLAEGPELSAEVDGGQIQQALTNLVVNGIQAMSHGGRLEVRIDRPSEVVPPPGVIGRPPSWVRLAVRDEGDGIPAENLERIFEPFFTTKGVGEGTGLGLSVTYGIVQEHGGWISVESSSGHGSCFTVHLPGGT